MTIDETIKAIQCCTNTPPKCGECPEHGPGFGIACRQDIRKWSVHYLERFEAQLEPRVLTLEELRRITELTPVWAEFRDPAMAAFHDGWVIRRFSRHYAEDDDIRQYFGTQFRYWTSEPTKEQREAEPWEK